MAVPRTAIHPSGGQSQTCSSGLRTGSAPMPYVPIDAFRQESHLQPKGPGGEPDAVGDDHGEFRPERVDEVSDLVLSRTKRPRYRRGPAGSVVWTGILTIPHARPLFQSPPACCSASHRTLVKSGFTRAFLVLFGAWTLLIVGVLGVTRILRRGRSRYRPEPGSGQLSQGSGLSAVGRRTRRRGPTHSKLIA